MAASVESARADVVIVNRLGLHARAASKLVTLAVRFRAQVQLEKDGHRVDAKSIMGVLLLCGTPGSTLTVTAEGEDAQEAVRAIAELVAGRFGEAE
ncbi:MAG: HPr family phosphocarrier protein [Sandaracinaceae bacterium]|nr:HPr family phosphocarrier protein [Sandaracinaceae bacterium]